MPEPLPAHCAGRARRSRCSPSWASSECRRAGDRPVARGSVVGLARRRARRGGVCRVAGLDAARGRGWSRPVARGVPRRAVEPRLVRPVRAGRAGAALAAPDARRPPWPSRLVTVLACAGRRVAHRHRASPGWGAWIAGTVFTDRRLHRSPAGSGTARCSCGRRRPGWPSARAEERNRIAARCTTSSRTRLTVSLLHVSSARLALDEDPPEARAGAGGGRAAGRESLDEVAPRGRPDAQPTRPDDRAAARRAATSPALVESVPPRRRRRASSHVDGDLGALTATRRARGLPDRAGGADQRRAARARPPVHGAGRRRRPDDVTSDGRQRRASGPPRRPALGLLGMRERAEALGGR